MGAWSKNWQQFNWDLVEKRMKEAAKLGITDFDIGITRDEMMEYIAWLEQNEPEYFANVFLAFFLMGEGVCREKSVALVEIMEEIKKWRIREIDT